MSFSSMARAEISDWKMAPGPLMTSWSKLVTPENALPEYPRPQLVRDQWQNLNGLWSYAITDKAAVQMPAEPQGKILVPYPLESALSGAMRPLQPGERLWYRRTFEIPPAWHGQRILLHFGAVNWETAVYLNGKSIGEHRGGYDAFSFDITKTLKNPRPQEITVSVSNPTDSGWQLRGKLALHPAGCSYTDCSGIWQTVWLEPVPSGSAEELKLVPDVDSGMLHVTVIGHVPVRPMKLVVRALDGTQVVGTASGIAGKELTPEVRKNLVDFYKATSSEYQATVDVPVSHAKLWSPDHPFLYDLTVEVQDDRGNAVDSVRSYFGMRKIEVEQVPQENAQLLLNHERILLPGALDQGFWPDGIYTAPTDDALKFDIEAAKKLGLMAVRKHVKIEPERWYYWADRLGLLVLQDMPTGEEGDPFTDLPTSPEAARQCEMEMKTLIEQRWNHPSIICWIMYNEGWGQHDTVSTVQWARQLDPTRLIDEASGFPFHGAGDVIDHHGGVAPGDPARIGIVSENGGWGLRTPGHDWSDKEWSYQTYDPATGGDTSGLDRQKKGDPLPALDEVSKAWFTANMVRFYDALWRDSAAVGETGNFFCQLIDVENECDGMLSYDRAVWKVDPDAVRTAARGKNSPAH